jgi:hypothetical protein
LDAAAVEWPAYVRITHGRSFAGRAASGAADGTWTSESVMGSM